jgi:hypothetical protein
MTRQQATKAAPWALGVLISIAIALGGWGLKQAYSHEGAVQRHESRIDAIDKRQDGQEADLREIRSGVDELLRRVPDRRQR